MQATDKKIWAVVPAAGIGERLGAVTPKQYLKINHKPIIEYAIEPLLQHTNISKVVIVLAPNDMIWSTLAISHHPNIITATGGEQRCDSVRNGLDMLSEAESDDWVLVHDAVRPCFTSELLQSLIQETSGHPVGGLLAIPPSDTLKLADEAGNVIKTVDRSGLWRAQTPQIFRFNVLLQSLDSKEKYTDESQGVEALGLQPKLVASSPTNIKVTQPADIALAEKLLNKYRQPEIF